MLLILAAITGLSVKSLVWLASGLEKGGGPSILKTAISDKSSHRYTRTREEPKAKRSVESVGCLIHFVSGDVIDLL